MKARVAILTACHNRKHQTLESLGTVLAQQLPSDVALDVFVLDDGSTDGTADELRTRFPWVTVMEGDGQQFWNGGMRQAFAAALERDFDYYLWLNDDTNLHEEALALLLRTHRGLSEADKDASIVVGTTVDPETRTVTYGGVERPSRLRPLRFELVRPGSEARGCVTMNGNCVLIPRSVAVRVGNLDPGYRHGLGDYDYGLRATALGCSVKVAPGIVGTCSRNSPVVTYHGSLPGELRKLTDTKGLPPADWARFARRWAGVGWWVFWLSPYVRRTLRVVGSRVWRSAARGLPR